ncbi:MAG: TraR/DksA C4-type zinc finger protein [Anaerolineales bacterium]|jgi:RNA polymerase-binding protein DksA
MERQINLDKMRKKLDKQKKELSARVEEEREKASPNSLANPDRSDLASDYSYRARRLSMVEQLEEQLEETTEALNRIDEGTYGQCTNCGNSIAPERLEALPAAELCIDCQRQKSQVS